MKHCECRMLVSSGAVGKQQEQRAFHLFTQHTFPAFTTDVFMKVCRRFHVFALCTTTHCHRNVAGALCWGQGWRKEVIQYKSFSVWRITQWRQMPKDDGMHKQMAGGWRHYGNIAENFCNIFSVVSLAMQMQIVKVYFFLFFIYICHLTICRNFDIVFLLLLFVCCTNTTSFRSIFNWNKTFYFQEYEIKQIIS